MEVDVGMGPPRGLILSLILFDVHISDLPKTLRAWHSELNVCATG